MSDEHIHRTAVSIIIIIIAIIIGASLAIFRTNTHGETLVKKVESEPVQKVERRTMRTLEIYDYDGAFLGRWVHLDAGLTSSDIFIASGGGVTRL